jgi:hypothetical protein
MCALGKEGFSEFVHKRNVTRVLESEELLSELSKYPGGRMDWRQFDEKGRAGKDALELLNCLIMSTAEVFLSPNRNNKFPPQVYQFSL